MFVSDFTLRNHNVCENTHMCRAVPHGSVICAKVKLLNFPPAGAGQADRVSRCTKAHIAAKEGEQNTSGRQSLGQSTSGPRAEHFRSLGQSISGRRIPAGSQGLRGCPSFLSRTALSVEGRGPRTHVEQCVY